MTNIGLTNINFSDLRTKWSQTTPSAFLKSDNTSALDPGPTNISLSEFRDASFTDGTYVPTGNSEISIETHFKNKTFGAASGSDSDSEGEEINHTTGSFKVYDNWSAYPYTPKKLTHDDGDSDSVGSPVANKRATLLTGQTSSSAYEYPIMLFTPGNPTSSSDSPGLIVDRDDPNCINEATLWLQVVSHSGYNQVQFGIVKKDDGLTWTQQLDYLDDYSATYRDRLSFHGAGFHNYAGSRDDIVSSDIEPISGHIYGSMLTEKFHNRNVTTGGTKKSNPDPGTVDNSYYFFKNSYYNYSTMRGNTTLSHIGLKVKWYETTIQADVTDGQTWILPSATLSPRIFPNLTNVFAGMYISGTGIPANTFIADVHTNYIKLYNELSVSPGTPGQEANADATNVTLTINGYLYWTLASPSTYNATYIMGPPHTVLPRIQEASTETKEWAFFIGDTTNGRTNTFEYDIRNTDPSGTPFSYSVTYSSGTLPTPPPAASYEFAINVGGAGTYSIAGSLSGETPDSSGYNFTTQAVVNSNFQSYVMGARIQFLSAGTVVALGAHNRDDSTMALYPDTSDTPASDIVTIAGHDDTSGSRDRDYNYTTLSSPVSVAANSIYRIGLKNSTGGYARHSINSYMNTATASGNIKLLGGVYKYIGSSASITRPSNTINNHYGSTDLIFIAS